MAIFSDYSKFLLILNFIHEYKNCIHSTSPKTFYAGQWTFRQHFVQIEAHFFYSFNIRIRSTTRPTLFDLYVAVMPRRTSERDCVQYVHDTILYCACKTNQQTACINSIEKDIQSISRWSNDANLIFNSGKTKVMVISTATSLTPTLTNVKTSPTERRKYKLKVR